MKDLKFVNRLADRFYKYKVLRFLFLNLYRKLYRERIAQHRAQVFKTSSAKVFGLFANALQDIGCEYWLTFGTLLGAIREKGIIKHDLDIDVAMFRDNRPDNLVELMAKRGFKRSRYIIVGDGQDGFEETYTCQEVSIDIFYFHKVEEKDEVYCYDFISDPQLHARDSMKKYGGLLARRIYLPFTGVSDFEFLGHQVKVPLNYDEYLSAHYGKDYMIPNPAWSTLTSPVARIMEGEIGKLVQFE